MLSVRLSKQRLAGALAQEFLIKYLRKLYFLNAINFPVAKQKAAYRWKRNSYGGVKGGCYRVYRSLMAKQVSKLGGIYSDLLMCEY